MNSSFYLFKLEIACNLRSSVLNFTGIKAMEQARFWKSNKGQANWKTRCAFSNSWEEEAFARDASQPFGAFIWPPRSYSCSFCRKEFRTAQALGGHMNVHRRDRARLKLLPNHHDETSCKPISDEDPDQFCALPCDAKPNSTPRVSALSIQENCDELSMISSTVQEHHEVAFSYFPQSRSNSVPTRVFSLSDSKRRETDPMKRKSRVDYEDNSSKSDLPMSLNWAIDPGKERTHVSWKRSRTHQTQFPFFPKESSGRRHDLQSQITERCHDSTAEDLDLELRLGDPPKVK